MLHAYTLISTRYTDADHPTLPVSRHQEPEEEYYQSVQFEIKIHVTIVITSPHTHRDHRLHQAYYFQKTPD